MRIFNKNISSKCQNPLQMAPQLLKTFTRSNLNYKGRREQPTLAVKDHAHHSHCTRRKAEEEREQEGGATVESD